MNRLAQLRRSTEKLLFNLFGGEELASVSLPMPDVEKFSGYLPYRSYDRDTELFYNDASVGFVLEIAPLTGADERVHTSLNQIFSDILMPGCDFHVVSYASPRISKVVQEWCYPRYLAGDVFAKIDLLLNDDDVTAFAHGVARGVIVEARVFGQVFGGHDIAVVDGAS